MCSCHSILECCVMFSGVKLSMGSFVLFGVGNPVIESDDNNVRETSCNLCQGYVLAV